MVGSKGRVHRGSSLWSWHAGISWNFPFSLASGYQASLVTGRHWQNTRERRAEASVSPALCFGCCLQQRLHLLWSSSHGSPSRMSQLLLGSSSYQVALDPELPSSLWPQGSEQLPTVGHFYIAQYPLLVVSTPLPSVKTIPCIIFPLLEIPEVGFVYLTAPCLMQNPKL